MRIAWIRNRYMFKSDDPNGKHAYAVYYDRKSKRYRAVQTTHLYIMDPKRKPAYKKGFIKEMKLPGFTFPSGVKNSYYSTATDGKPISLKHPDVLSVSKRHLPKQKARMIINHARRKET